MNRTINNTYYEEKLPLISRRKRKFIKRQKWSEKEKETLFSVLKEFGFHNLKQFSKALPRKTESQIIYFLKKYKKSALAKFKRKNDYFVQHTLDIIHPWMSFINVHCDVTPVIHKNLIAFILPFIERYGNHPKPEDVGGINFRLAYKALFNSLTENHFSCDINNETCSMMYACLHQLLDDIRTNQDDVESKMFSCVNRCTMENTRKVTEILMKNIFQLPEINVLNFTPKELEELCQKIS